MATMRTAVITILAILHLVFAADPEQMASAGVDPMAKAAYFVDKSSSYVFALNVADNGDVYYHMNALATHSWMGVGFGGTMNNVRMLISYIGEDGHTLTNSCRYSSGHNEPELEPDMVIEGVTTDIYAPYHNTLSPDGIMIAHAVCRNCSIWKDGALDLTNTAQQFVFALGPNKTLHSDDPAANLRLHEFHGTFQLDMTVATNTTGAYGRVPAPQDPGLQVGDGFWAFANYYSSDVYSTGTDTAWFAGAHAAFMGIAFLLILPLGALSLRLVRKVRYHALAQMLGLVFVAVGFALGVYCSTVFNKSKHFNSTHQIIGLLIMAALLIQIGLGLSHHFIYMRAGTPTIMGKTHRFLGISILTLGIVNGFIGLKFAGNPMVPWGVVVAIMLLIFAAIGFFTFRHNRSHAYRPEKEAFVPSNYDQGDYEMNETPFASRGYVQTPRTPFFGLARNDEEEYSARDEHRAKGGATVQVRDSLYTDTPASDVNPFKGKWEAVPERS